jgi:tripartite-type tricarboxylate transporter receptor subunit TctC
MTNASAFGVVVFAALSIFAVSPAMGQAYPVKSIRIIVPNPPGGGTDTMARLVSQKVGPALGQQIIVDNRPGGGGRIAAELVLRAPKDGYTLFQASASPLITGPALFPEVTNYDPLKDFAPVTLNATTGYVLAAHPSVPVKSVKDLIQIARSKKDSLTYGSTGPGSSAHLGMKLFESMTKVSLIHVPFKGSSPAMVSLTSGEIDIMFGNYQATLGLVRAGRLRALAQSSPNRSSFAPDIPTISESGVPGFELRQIYSIVAPAGTPMDIIRRLNQEIAKHLPTEDVKKQMASHGIEIEVSTPEELGKLLASQLAIWTKVIREAGIKASN